MIILPECSEDKVSNDLRYLTEVLYGMGADISSGMLGGEYGYGAYFENDVFMMHPYCWCEQDDCPWCLVCTCPDDAWVYRVNGEVVDWKHFLDADLTIRSSTRIPELICDYCEGKIERSPNFLHKPSGTNISWYKYIGRGMDINLFWDWVDIFNSCIKSLDLPTQGE